MYEERRSHSLHFNSELADEVPTAFASQTSIFRGGIMVASVDRASEVVDQALPEVYELLKTFATREDFVEKVAIAFGNNFDPETLEILRQQWASGDFEDFPEIEVRSAAELNGANGAFAANTNTIYLSRDYLERNGLNLPAVTNVLLEEYGHFVDAQANQMDAAGDEGAIFVDLVQNKRLAESRIAQLKNENDTATLEIDLQPVQVEQQTTLGQIFTDENSFATRVLGFAGDLIRVDLKQAFTPDERGSIVNFGFADLNFSGGTIP